MRVRRAAALLCAIAVALLATVVVAGPAAAGVSERIVDYRSEVTIETDGTIEVHETIVYDFGVVPHHGIFRVIPVRTEQSGKDGYDRVYPLDVVSVTGSEGTPDQYTVEEDGDNERIKIGDPDRDHHRRAHLRHRLPRARRDERVRRSRRAGAGTRSASTGRCRSSRRPRWCTHRPTSSRSACATGYYGSTLPCASRHDAPGPTPSSPASQLAPYQGMTFIDRDPEGRDRAVAHAHPRGAVQLHVGVPGHARTPAGSPARCWRCSSAS